jgi:hypothetical protein
MDSCPARGTVGLKHDQSFPQRVVADVLPIGGCKLLIDAQAGLLNAPVPDFEKRIAGIGRVGFPCHQHLIFLPDGQSAERPRSQMPNHVLNDQLVYLWAMPVLRPNPL